MKQILMLMIMAMVSISTSAQIGSGFRMGVRANGGGSALISEEDYKPTFGYGLHWMAEYDLTSSMFFQSGAGIENIAHKRLSKTFNVLYAQIPLHVGYRFVNESKNTFFMQAGPSIGIGLWGTEIDVYGDDIHHPENSSGPEAYFDYRGKRFNLGIGGRVGIETGKFQISAGADYGVLKATKYGGHNLSVNLGLAYMFGRN